MQQWSHAARGLLCRAVRRWGVGALTTRPCVFAFARAMLILQHGLANGDVLAAAAYFDGDVRNPTHPSARSHPGVQGARHRHAPPAKWRCSKLIDF